MMTHIIKLIIGVLACAFALAHVYVAVNNLIEGGESGPFAASAYMGHLVGIAVGLIVAILCFRKTTPPLKTDGNDD